jgi:hypothetical protein
MPDVMDVTPAGRTVTAGVLAMPVACDHRRRIAGGIIRVARPISTGSEPGPNTTRLTVQSQAV